MYVWKLLLWCHGAWERGQIEGRCDEGCQKELNQEDLSDPWAYRTILVGRKSRFFGIKGSVANRCKQLGQSIRGKHMEGWGYVSWCPHSYQSCYGGVLKLKVLWLKLWHSRVSLDLTRPRLHRSLSSSIILVPMKQFSGNPDVSLVKSPPFHGKYFYFLIFLGSLMYSFLRWIFISLTVKDYSFGESHSTLS